MTNEVVKQKIDIVAVMLFKERILDRFGGISQVMRHIPRYCHVTDRVREDIFTLFSNPDAAEHAVKFSMTAEGDKDYLAELVEVVQEKMKASKKK